MANSDPDHALTAALAHWSEHGLSGFNEALRCLYPEIQKVAKNLLRDSDLTLSPETLAQEISAELSRLPRSSWVSRRPFFGFLYTKMRQHLWAYRRKRNAQRRIPLPGSIPGPSPRYEFAENELRHFLTETFRETPEICATVLLRIAGLTNDEIAGRLNVAPSTIDRNLKAAKLRLKMVYRHTEAAHERD